MMHLKTKRAALIYLIVSLFLISACSQTNSAFITFSFSQPVSSVTLASSDGMTETVVQPSSSDSKILSSVNAPDSVSVLYVAVCEKSYSVDTLLASKVLAVDTHVSSSQVAAIYTTTVTLEVPAGDNRKILVYGAGPNPDMNNMLEINYIGTTEDNYAGGLSLSPGEEATIGMTLYAPAYSYGTTSDQSGNTIVYFDASYDSQYYNWVEDSCSIYAYVALTYEYIVLYRGKMSTGYTFSPTTYYLGEVKGHSEIFGLDSSSFTIN